MVMESRIKWKKLKTIAQALFNTKVSIYATTEVDRLADPNLRAVLTQEEDGVGILINLNRNKTLDDMIDCIAHEGAHYTLNSPDHDKRFGEEQRRLRNIIINRYEGRGNVKQ